MSLDRARINALMDQASAGDAGAFGTLASMVQNELYRLALAQGLRREDAVEVTQEALMRAYTARSEWRRGAEAMAWLCGISINVIREFRRRERRRGTSWVELSDHDVSGEKGRDRFIGSSGLGLEQLQYLMDAVTELPPRQREAIACRYLRRMSIRETAEAMGCAEGTVKSAVAAALERLRGLLEDDQ
jgi:RNA polymerase sigma-70 factor, ECF subfamily